MLLDSFIGPIYAQDQLPKYLNLRLPMTVSMRYSVIWNPLIIPVRILGLVFFKKMSVSSARGQSETLRGTILNRGKLPYILYNN